MDINLIMSPRKGYLKNIMLFLLALIVTVLVMFYVMQQFGLLGGVE